MARSKHVRRRVGGISGAGIVLLTMLLLAIVVGVGAGAIKAYYDENEQGESPESAHVVAGDNAPGNSQAAPENEAQQPSDTGAGTGAEAQIGAASGDESAAAAQPAYIAPRGVTAQAIHGFDPATGQLLFSQDAQTQMPVGSIVKVATALVTVEHAELDETVVIDETDLVDFTVYSNMGLIPGDTLTVEQLLQGLLVASGGDAAEALARYVGGQMSGSDDPETARAAFIEEMNAYAARLGLQNTRFATVAGDDAENGYSSAEDVSILAGELMANPALAEIVGQFEYSFTGANGVNTYTGYNTNALLGDSGVIGVKTGSTGSAGGCVVLARQTADGGVVIITVLGSDLTYNELNQIVTDARWDDAQLLFSQLPA